jgi:hypothetical protein
MPKSCRSILYRESKKRISTIMYNILKNNIKIYLYKYIKEWDLE